MCIRTISKTEVVVAIKILKNTSVGLDEVPAHILKQNVHLFIKLLAHLVNSSIKNGMFPAELKIAKVVPIFKANDKQNIKKQPFFSRIIEKAMYNHLLDVITKHNILHKYQFGFRKQHSTNHAVISLVEKLLSIYCLRSKKYSNKLAL